MSISHIADVDHRTVHREFVEPVHDGRAGIQRYVPLELADLLCAGRQHEVLRRYGIDDVVGRDVMRLHRLLIEVDLPLRTFPPYGGGRAAPLTVASCGRMKFCPRSLLPALEALDA